MKRNVTYIVAAVVMDGDKVLLVQEAKLSCRGLWYLPAGRMERDETIVVRVCVVKLGAQTALMYTTLMMNHYGRKLLREKCLKRLECTLNPKPL